MSNETFIKMLSEQYQEVEDSELVNEALASLTSYMTLMNFDDLLRRSRPLALSYLALSYVKRKEEERV